MHFLFFISFGALLTNADVQNSKFLRTYECTDKGCERTSQPVLASDLNIIGAAQHGSLQACRLVCLEGAGIWPIPTGPISTGKQYVAIHPQSFKFTALNRNVQKPARDFLRKAQKIFIKNVNATCGSKCNPNNKEVVVNMNVESSALDLNWETDEKYDLKIVTTESNVSVTISAATIYGLRHGLETLSQLIVPVSTFQGRELVILHSANITDQPVYRHRGLLIDTSRNFMPVRNILLTIDALASVKMNILHWHATDTQSFPVEIPSLPLMAKFGAYSAEKIYTVQDMMEIKSYANSRGVRVILEIDSPSHAGSGWEWGDSMGLGNLSVCVNQQPWRKFCIQPPCGQLNPANPNVFRVLKNLYEDLVQIFGRDGMMHIGGDEVFIDCWRSSEEVLKGMTELGLGHETEDFIKLWSYFHNKQRDVLNEACTGDNRTEVIIWSSHLTTPELIEAYLDKKHFIVQTWVEANKTLNNQLLELGYKLIVSTKDAWYLDHGFWGITKYHIWRDAYNNIIPRHSGVLGGEACMWSEYVFPGSLDSKIWPRTAAVAERLWSNPTGKGATAKAEPRLHAHIDRLKLLGVLPDAIAPEWCNQHDGQCL